MTGDTLREMEKLLCSINTKVDSLDMLSTQINIVEQKRLDTLQERRKKRRYITVFSIIAVVVFILLLSYNAIQYNIAELAYKNGNYDKAVRVYRNLDEYRDSHERMQGSYYALAEQLITRRDWQGASKAFLSAGNYSDAAMRVWEPYDIAAEDMLERGRYNDAWRLYISLVDYPDALKKAWAIRYRYLNVGDIAAGNGFSLGLRSDGTVEYIGENLDAYTGKDIGEEISEWTDVIAVFASKKRAVALKGDGTVTVAGGANIDKGILSEWNNVVYISICDGNVYALKSDGTVLSMYRDEAQSLTDIITLAAGEYYIIGLMRDRTTSVVERKYRFGGLPKWHDVDMLFNTYKGVAGLKDDYLLTVDIDLTVKMRWEWLDIVSMSGEDKRTVGVKADGTIRIAGEPGSMKNWTNILVTASSYNHTIALKSDGTVVADGNNDYGQCDVSGFVNIGCKQTLQ